jgi:hypothetical protein
MAWTVAQAAQNERTPGRLTPKKPAPGRLTPGRLSPPVAQPKSSKSTSKPGRRGT